MTSFRPFALTWWPVRGRQLGIRRLRFLDLSTGAWTRFVADGLELHPGAWNHAGDRYATVGFDAAGRPFLWIWDPMTGDVVVERSFTRPELIGVAFSQDDALVSVTDKSGRVSLLDARTLEPVTADVQLEGTGSGGLLGSDNRTALFFTPGYQPDQTFEHPSQAWLLMDLLTGETVNEGDVGLTPTGSRGLPMVTTPPSWARRVRWSSSTWSQANRCAPRWLATRAPAGPWHIRRTDHEY